MRINPLLRTLLVSLILSFPFLHAQAQKAPGKYVVDGHKCKKATIVDPGELYSTYQFDETELEMLSAAVGNTLAGRVNENHTEDRFPVAMQDLDARTDNPERMKAFRVYKLARLDDKWVLVVPAKYNKHQPSGWAPQQDFFLVMRAEGVK